MTFTKILFVRRSSIVTLSEHAQLTNHCYFLLYSEEIQGILKAEESAGSQGFTRSEQSGNIIGD